MTDAASAAAEDMAEEKRTTRVRDQGRPDGLFRGCMDAIRTSHSIGQALRTAMIAAGLMTDQRCYSELLCQFYVCTAALEKRLAGQPAEGMVTRLAAATGLAGGFTSGYEADLAYLLGGGDWRSTAGHLTSEVATRYIQRIEGATEVELAAAVFILWGPLAIGGGAALKPRVKKVATRRPPSCP